MTVRAAPAVDVDFATDFVRVGRIDAVERMLEVVCRTTGLGFSAVARVTDARWIACAVRDQINFGLRPGGELDIETTICNEIRQSGELVAIDDVAEDVVYCTHHTPRQYGFRSYISVPINLRNGQFFGTLCAIDPSPHRVNTPETIATFNLFAELIAMHLDAQDRVEASEAALLSEREAAQLREQFIAVLGHDLRNPLAAIQNGVELLKLSPQSDDDVEVLEVLARSVTRMGGLIENTLDFARGRLGGGISLHAATIDLEPVLWQVIDELRPGYPQRPVEVNFTLTYPVRCDPQRIGQMLSNLLGNAFTHGIGQITVQATSDEQRFELKVTNLGEPIPKATMNGLFQPFVRGSAGSGNGGLGLGLFIASEIARAHGGTLDAHSDEHATTFTFRMPRLATGVD